MYRVFYYDCPPMNKQVYHPLLKKAIDLGKSTDYIWANDFLRNLNIKENLRSGWADWQKNRPVFKLSPMYSEK